MTAAYGLTAAALMALAGYLAFMSRGFQALGEQTHFWLVDHGSEARGLKLLKEWLSAEQRQAFDSSRSFEVIGCHGGKRYRITYGTATNVYELNDDGQPIAGWCFIPQGYLVAGDVGPKDSP